MTNVVTDPKDFPHEFDSALNAGDLKRLVALYAEDAVLRTQSNDIRSGKAAVRAEMEQLIAARANITNTLRHTLRHGETALIIVNHVLRLTAPDGAPVVLTGTATNVLQEHPAKGWRMIIANPQGVG
jgi:uncharacterized protein (TIGR02246 family)